MQGGVKYLQRHTVCRMEGHYAHTYLGPVGAKHLQSGFCFLPIKPARKQRCSLESSIRDHTTTSWAQRADSKRDQGPEAPVSPSCPFYLAAHYTGWFWDGVQCQLSGLGRHDQFSLFWQGKAFLEDTQKATIVTNGAWQALDRGSYNPGLTKKRKKT